MATDYHKTSAGDKVKRVALRKGGCRQMNAWKKILKEWILPLGAEVLVIVFLLKVVFMLVLVPSGSMLPTIQKNSILFCTYIHDISQVERGQILVFESDELGKTLIKRLVGLPGETVAIREDGTVTVDGQVLDESAGALSVFGRQPSRLRGCPLLGRAVHPSGKN